MKTVIRMQVMETSLRAHLLSRLSRLKKSSGLLLKKSGPGLKGLVLFSGLVALPGPLLATGLVAGATEFTQIANNIQLGLQYETQLEQYITQYQHLEAQLTDMKLNPSSVMGSEVTTVIGKVGGMMSAGQAIGGTFARIDGNIAKKYDNKLAGTFADKFKTWTTGNQDSLSASMRAAGLHRDGYANDTAALNALYSKTQSSQGTVAGIQTLSEITAMQVQQTQKLQDLVATQNVATSDYMAAQNAKEQAREDRAKKVHGIYEPMTSVDTKKAYDLVK